MFSLQVIICKVFALALLSLAPASAEENREASVNLTFLPQGTSPPPVKMTQRYWLIDWQNRYAASRRDDWPLDLLRS